MKTKLLLSVTFLCGVLISNGQWTYNTLSQAKGRMGVAVNGTKVYFAGGADNANNPLSEIEVYDVESESWVTPPQFALSVARMHPEGVTCGPLVIFAGGGNMINFQMFDEVDIWNTETEQWSMASLATPRVFLSAVSNGEQALFAGGNNLAGAAYNVVDIFDRTTGNWTISSLSQARSGMGAAVAGDLAFFAGGYLDPTSTVTNRVDIYHFSSGTWTQETLSEARGFLTAATVGNKVLFAGGTRADNTPSDIVDIYNVETLQWEAPATLSEARALFPLGSAVTCDNKAWFLPGGHFDLYSHSWTTDFNVVDIYDASLDLWYVDELSTSNLLYSVAGAEDHLIVAGGALPPGWDFTENVEIFADPDYPDCIPVSIPEQHGEDMFTVYPNPSSGNIHLYMADDSHKSIMANIYTMQGKIVMTRTLKPGAQDLHVNLPDGIYLLQVISDKDSQTALITIQK
ncbi:MAG: T9SS type A sorting domain-containing protein [Bacteroidales bacterium]|nr:T9SS type A sorting domain-containing protein [Bacteroidales bacterium]